MAFYPAGFSKETYETCLRIVHLKAKRKIISYIDFCSPVKCDLMAMNFPTLPSCTYVTGSGEQPCCSVKETSKGPSNTFVRFPYMSLIKASVQLVDVVKARERDEAEKI